MSGQQDMQAHSETYAGVINMIKWGTIGSMLVGALVVFLIAS
jgi:Bacterial aa3 type cytochrome c oxidase subunit IV